MSDGGMATELDPDSMYRIIIKETMDKAGLRAENIPREEPLDPKKLEVIRRSLRYHRTKGFAKFCCVCGLRKWGSAHAWCILDLRRQKVAHKYEQQCQSCNAEAKPVFDEESMKKMAQYAVDSYLIKTGKLKITKREGDEAWRSSEDDLPHDERRCNMCSLVGGSCWKKPVAVRTAVNSDEECTLSSVFAARLRIHK